MKPISIKHVALVGLLALAGGCTPMPRIVSAPQATPTELLAFQDRLNRAAPTELTKQYNALNAIPAQSRNDGQVLELALLLSQPGFPMRNDAAALQLLQDREARKPSDSTLVPFVRWLRAALQERVRLAASAEDAASQLRDEKKRADACNDKLQAIRKMEDSLIERNQH
jgi:hypothetical protein